LVLFEHLLAIDFKNRSGFPVLDNPIEKVEGPEEALVVYAVQEELAACWSK